MSAYGLSKGYGLKNKTALAVVLLFLVSLIVFSKDVIEASKNSLALCFNVVIPSLFPFFVLSQLSIELGFAKLVGPAFEKMMTRLFNVGGVCAPAFILGIIGGYPTGARIAAELYEKKLCAKAEAERLTAFCNNSGPAFVMSSVGVGMLSNSRAGVILYVSHFIAAILVGIIFGFYKRGERKNIKNLNLQKYSTINFAEVFIETVKSSFASIINICAFIIFFSVVIKVLFLTGIIPVVSMIVSRPFMGLGLDFHYISCLLTGSFEVTTGLWELSRTGGSLYGKMLMSALLLGLAGLSVHCQALIFILKSGLSSRAYFLGKILHGIISVFILWLTMPLFSGHLYAFKPYSGSLHIFGLTGFWDSFKLSLFLCLLSVFIILLSALMFYLKNIWKNKKK